MDITAVFNFLATSGIEVLSAVHAAIQTPQDRRTFKHQFQLSNVTVNKLVHTAQRFFANDEQAALRQRAVAVARRGHLSLEALTTISTALSHLHPQATLSEAEVLLEIVQWSPDQDIEMIKSHARARIKQLNGEAAPRSRRWLRFSKNPDASGMRYLIAKLDDAALASVMSALHPIARGICARHPHISQQQALADALVAQVTRKNAQATDLRREGLILLPADGLRHIGDNMLATTDGAQIPADELAEHLLADFGYALLYDADCQPVNLYRTRRLANEPQRIILAADQLLCVDPDCDRPAHTAQAHHLKAWQYGGETNLDNLVAACATHNALNDDNPQRPRNGHYIRDPDTGRASYQPPDGGPIQHNRFPLAEKSGRAWAIKHFQEPGN